MTDEIEFLTGGDELFNEPRFVDHYSFMRDSYIPRIDKPIAFFLSCSKHKPYSKSPYRRVFYAMLEKKIGIKKISQIYTVSEPAIIVPEELEETNITHYDFPPQNLQDKGKEIFIQRLSEVLPKLIQAHKFSFYILPKHHRTIFELALSKISNNNVLRTSDKIHIPSRVKYAPPLTYNLPKARKIITEVLETFNI